MFSRILKIFIVGFFATTLTWHTQAMEQKYQTLDLSNESLTDEDFESPSFKEGIQKLVSDNQIKIIDLSGNKLTHIPEFLLELPQRLILNNNPLCENTDKPKSDKRGDISDDIKHTQNVVKQVTNFFSSKEKKDSNKYEIIELGKVTIIVAPGSNINHKELELNTDNKLVFISRKKQETKPSWFMKYVVGGGATLIVIATSFLVHYHHQISELIYPLICTCEQ